jgi:hypothetical protein
MNLTAMIQRLQALPGMLTSIVSHLSDEDLRWRPPEQQWSIVEVLCHLADEEVEDFRTRLRLTLEQNNEPWPPINPPQAAIDRKYREQSPAEALARFTRERVASIEWLTQLHDADWSVFCDHPKLGRLHAGDLLASWVAHDALHMRQIAKRMFQMAQRDATGFGTAYAGEWQA